MADVFLAKMENPRKSIFYSLLGVNPFYPPLGLLYVANAVEKTGLSVKIFHEVGTRRDIRKLVNEIKSNDPIFVGFTTTTGPQLLPTVKASQAIKQCCDTPIVWGGIHPTILPEQTLSEPFVDVIVKGEGEETCAELAQVMCSRVDLSQVRGIGYKENGRLKFTREREFVQNLDAYTPSWHLVDVRRYFRRTLGEKRVLPIVTSRGCPHRCGFCYNTAVRHRVWKGHTVGAVTSQVKELERKYGIDGVIFCDDNLFTDRERALQMVAALDLPWYSEIRADYLSPSFAKKLVNCNCRELFVGAESGSQRILDAMHKDLTLQQIVNAVQICRDQKISLELSFMTGLPIETWEDISATLSFIDYCTKIFPEIMVDLKIYTPYPGTSLWDLALKYGLKVPARTIDWVRFEREQCNNPWVTTPLKSELICQVCNLVHMRRLPFFLNLLRSIEMVRWKNKYFEFPMETQLYFLIEDLSANFSSIFA